MFLEKYMKYHRHAMQFIMLLMAWDLLRCWMNNLRKFLCKYGTSKSLIVRRRRQQRSISMSNDLLRIKKVFNKPIFQCICIQYWLSLLKKLILEESIITFTCHNKLIRCIMPRHILLKKLDIEMKCCDIYMSQYIICLLFYPRVHHYDV